MKASLITAALLLAACTPTEPLDTAPKTQPVTLAKGPSLLTWSDLLSRERPQPTTTVRLGAGETDLVDLWLPGGEGPHPVVIMVHGGCWQKSIADRTLMNYAAEELRRRGMAVWNIEYRGVDEDGGGYPGTYRDVARAADAVRDHAGTYNLDLSRVVGTGHSAGGHLVTWLAARANLPETSPLYSADPLTLTAIMNVGGLADLQTSAKVTQADCLADVLDDLTGPASAAREDVFSDTSPSNLLPLGIPFISASGDMDRIAPPGLAIAITDLALAAGDTDASAMVLKGANHVDLIAPGTPAFEAQAAQLERWLGLKP